MGSLPEGKSRPWKVRMCPEAYTTWVQIHGRTLHTVYDSDCCVFMGWGQTLWARML